MGEKRVKKALDFTCKYCEKRYNLQELKEEGYVEETKCGLVIMCPNIKCEAEQLIEIK